MKLYKGRAADKLLNRYDRTGDIPEGVYLIEDGSCYVAVFNPDDTLVLPTLANFGVLEEAVDYLRERAREFRQREWGI